MYINSKAISWLILAGGLFLYLWNITDNQFTYATIFMAGSILLWMLVGFSTDSFNSKEFAQVLSGAGFLLAISVFFLHGLEEISYPAGAIVFHSDGIAKALGLGIAASLPLLFGITNVAKDAAQDDGGLVEDDTYTTCGTCPGSKLGHEDWLELFGGNTLVSKYQDGHFAYAVVPGGGSGTETFPPVMYVVDMENASDFNNVIEP